MFERLKIPYKGAKTKTGQYSTDEDKLLELAPEFPIIQTILNYRGLTKLKSTYVDALPKMVNPRTGRIHSSFNQALAATGRLSSNNPNLQNIPVRTPEGAKVRRAFIPRDENHTLLSADYSQIELRLLAHVADIPQLKQAFQTHLAETQNQIKRLEQVFQSLGCLGFGKGTAQRSNISDLHFIPHMFVLEIRIGQKGKFQRSYGTFDRHLGDMHHQFAAFPIP